MAGLSTTPTTSAVDEPLSSGAVHRSCDEALGLLALECRSHQTLQPISAERDVDEALELGPLEHAGEHLLRDAIGEGALDRALRHAGRLDALQQLVEHLPIHQRGGQLIEGLARENLPRHPFDHGIARHVARQRIDQRSAERARQRLLGQGRAECAHDRSAGDRAAQDAYDGLVGEPRREQRIQRTETRLAGRVDDDAAGPPLCRAPERDRRTGRDQGRPNPGDAQ